MNGQGTFRKHSKLIECSWSAGSGRGHSGSVLTKVGKVIEFRKIMICFKIVTFKRFGQKIVKFKQIILKFGK